MRIVSLIPSATEIVCALGLRDNLVGVTHECDYPPDVASVRKVTHTLIPTDATSERIDELVRSQLNDVRALYRLNHEAIRKAAPDLIISQTLCDVCAVADREVRDVLQTFAVAPQVLYLEPTRLADIFQNIRDVANAAQMRDRGDRVCDSLEQRVATIRARNRNASKERVVVLEWLDPLFSSGHWTPELVEIAGATEPLAKAGARSQQISIEELVAADPDQIMIACCGYSIARTREDLPAFLEQPEIAKLCCVREKRVFLVDGSAYFSRPGPRLVDSLEILAHAIDPSSHPLPDGLPPAVSAYS